MPNYPCPVCESNIDISVKVKSGERLTCDSCFAQLSLRKHDGKMILACAICKETVFDPGNCEDCERRREKKRLLEEGRL
jgi:hypothetical protein